jgi:CHAD domain-containing protein
MADGKWIDGLSPRTPVAEAARAALGARFAVVRHYLPLAVEKPYDDIEYVHQLRVGTRRAAAALRAFEDALPYKPFKDVKRTLRALRRAAGDARDWDVFRAALDTAKPVAASKPAGDFLAGYAFGERAAAQLRLASAASEAGPLFAERGDELVARARDPEGAPAAATFGDLAAAQLGALLAEFTEGVRAHPKEPDALHALRIVGKRLRYAIELFAGCFPPALRETVYPAVERAQEVLGDVQDAVVGAARLAGIRAAVGAAMPKQLARVRKGIDGWAKSLRARVPAGKKAFAAWRTEWLDLTNGLALEVVAATASA